MKHRWWIVLAFFPIPIVSAQQTSAQQTPKTQSVEKARNRAALSAPIGVAREAAAAARDFATFRDPAWSALTLAQIGAASADAATSLNNLRACPSCLETGVSRFFVGSRPDAHKYLIGGAIEVGVEAVASHYFHTHGPVRKWYWKTLWTLPQSFSLYEHARAADHNSRLNLACAAPAPTCP